MKKLIGAVLLLLLLNFGLLKAQITTLQYDHPNGQKVILLNFAKAVSSDYALAEIRRLNLKPATLEEMLSFLDGQYDQSLRKKTIIAIGSSWQTIVCRIMVPYSNKKSLFNLQWIEEKWDKNVSFMTMKETESGYSLAELNKLYEAAPPIANDAGEPSNRGDDHVFINNKYRLIMLTTYHPSINGLEGNSMNEHSTWSITLGGQIIDIPNRLSYQSIREPKKIGCNIVFQAIDRSGKPGLYAVVEVSSKKTYYVR